MKLAAVYLAGEVWVGEGERTDVGAHGRECSVGFGVDAIIHAALTPQAKMTGPIADCAPDCALTVPKAWPTPPSQSTASRRTLPGLRPGHAQTTWRRHYR